MKGRVAVITGGASGIGLACARELATRSITVVIADRDLAGATRAAESMEGKAYAIDVGIASDLEPLADAIERAMGPVSMLINAAGIIQGDLLAPQELSYEQCERLFRINLLGTQAACAAFGSRMARRGAGSILNIGSIAGMRSTPLHAYGPLKAAVIRLTENLAAEWGRSGVRVNCLSPGSVLTPAMQQAIDTGQRDRTRIEQSAATGRIVLPEEVAKVAAFLLSDDASAITGVNLPVDHGWLVANSWASFGGLRDAV